jgi:hypothetical protein
MRQVDPEFELDPYNSVLFFLESRRSKSYGTRECIFHGNPVRVSDILEVAHRMVVTEEYGDYTRYAQSRDRRPATIVWKNVRYTYDDAHSSDDDYDDVPGGTDEDDSDSEYIDEDDSDSEYGDGDVDDYGTGELLLKLNDGDCIVIE